MRFQNLTATGIVYVRTACVRYIGRFIYDSGMTCILQTPCRIVGRSFFSKDCVLESGFFKSRLPVVDTLNQIGNPLLGGSRINVNHNRILRFYQFSVQVFFDILVFRLKTPAGNLRFILHSLGIFVKVLVTDSKVTDSAIIQSRFHRFFGEQHHRTVQLVCQRRAWCGRRWRSGSHRRRCPPLEGAYRTDFDIPWKCLQSIYVAGVIYHASYPGIIFRTARKGEQFVIPADIVGHIYDIIARLSFFTDCLQGEGGYNGLYVGVQYRLIQSQCIRRMFYIRDFTNKQFIAVSFFETDHFVSDLIARIAHFTFLHIYGSFHDPVHDQYVTSKEWVGDFKIIFTLYMVHFEEAVHRFSLGSDHSCIRLQGIFLPVGQRVRIDFGNRLRLTFLFLLLFKNVCRLCPDRWNEHRQNH